MIPTNIRTTNAFFAGTLLIAASLVSVSILWSELMSVLAMCFISVVSRWPIAPQDVLPQRNLLKMAGPYAQRNSTQMVDGKGVVNSAVGKKVGIPMRHNLIGSIPKLPVFAGACARPNPAACFIFRFQDVFPEAFFWRWSWVNVHNFHTNQHIILGDR